MDFQIREMNQDDWKDVKRIYQNGMDTNNATFQVVCPSYEEFNTSHIAKCRFVITDHDIVIGWAALTTVSSRCVYSGVAEVSIYIDEAYKGQGAGTALLMHLVQQSEQEGFWTIQAGIMQENTTSIRLHEKCGFRLIGFREKIGKDRLGQWRNTVLMEKRSQLARYT